MKISRLQLRSNCSNFVVVIVVVAVIAIAVAVVEHQDHSLSDPEKQQQFSTKQNY